jgi:hypothetical protein
VTTEGLTNLDGQCKLMDNTRKARPSRPSRVRARPSGFNISSQDFLSLGPKAPHACSLPTLFSEKLTGTIGTKKCQAEYRKFA